MDTLTPPPTDSPGPPAAEESFEFHPVCLAFPAYDPQTYARRLADYRLHPERAGDTPVLLARDADGKWKVADGRHHLKICKQLGYEVAFERFEGSSRALVALVTARNANRRHNTESQVAASLVALDSWARGGDRRSGDFKTARAVLKSQEQVARGSGISADTLQRAAKVAKDAPELLPAVRDGRLDAKTAAQVARLPAKERRKVAEAADPKKAAKERLAAKKGATSKAPPAREPEASQDRPAGTESPDPGVRAAGPTAPDADPDDPDLDPRFMPHADEASELTARFRNWKQRLEALRAEVRRTFPDREHVVGGRIDARGQFDAALTQLVDTLDQNVPECVCPACCGTGEDGGRCRFCDGYGAIDRTHHQGLTPRWKATAPRLAALRAAAEGGAA